MKLPPFKVKLLLMVNVPMGDTVVPDAVVTEPLMVPPPDRTSAGAVLRKTSPPLTADMSSSANALTVMDVVLEMEPEAVNVMVPLLTMVLPE